MAIACVYHLGTIPYIYPTGLPFESIGIMSWIYKRGSIFVELFLVISGLSTFLAYSERINQGMKFAQYAQKRIIRIYPLMLATLLITLVGQLVYFRSFGAYFWGGENTLETIILNCLGLQHFFSGNQSWNAPAWSLSIFFMCWLIFYPMIALTRDTQNKDTLRAALCAVIVLLGIGLIRNTPANQITIFNVNAPRGFVAFFSGGIVYYIDQTTRKNDDRVITAAAAILLFFFLCRYFDVEVGNYTIVFGTVIFPAILLLALKSRYIGAILSVRPLQYLGKISFSIYLCNFPIELTVEWLDKTLNLHINYSSQQFFFCFFAVHIIVGSIFYLIFEKKVPYIIKKRRNI